MRPGLTYEEYALRGGALPREAFDACVGPAEDEVRYLVGPNEVTDRDAYVRAVAAAMEAAAGEVTHGVSIGSFRVESNQDSTPAQLARDAAWRVLAPTGMLYGGLA